MAGNLVIFDTSALVDHLRAVATALTLK